MGNCQFLTQTTSQPVLVEKNTETPYSLLIKSVTWKKESYGLFDYENKNIISSLLKTTRPGVLKKIGDDILLLNNQNIFPNSDNASPTNKLSHKEEKSMNLLSISIKQNFFWINNYNKNLLQLLYNPPKTPKNESPKSSQLNAQKTYIENTNNYKQILENGPWLVVRFYKDNKGYPLVENDFIKLGRIAFKVQELVINKIHITGPRKECPKGSTKSIISRKSTQINPSINNINENSEGLKQCRICLSDSVGTPLNSNESKNNTPIDDDNPYIDPCLCSGTMKYIHIKCLQFWLASKIQTKQTSECCKTMSWKNMECELCKFEFPMTFKKNNKTYDLVSIPKPETSSYLILDILSKDNLQNKGIHIVNLEGKDVFSVGRGNENDLKISDISVSRAHAIFKKKNNELVLEDCNSKFGTLALMKKAYPLKNTLQTTAIQIGRIVIYFNLVATNDPSCTLCCGNDKKNDILEKIDEELISADEAVFEKKENFLNINNNENSEIASSNQEESVENNDHVSHANILTSQLISNNND